MQLSTAVLCEFATNLVAVLNAVIFAGIAVEISDFLVTYQSVSPILVHAFCVIDSLKLVCNSATFLALLLLVIVTVPALAS